MFPRPPSLRASLYGLSVAFAAAAPTSSQTHTLDIAVRTGATFSSIDAQVAVNDQRTIAFTGADAKGNGVFAMPDQGQPRALAPQASSRNYSAAAINDTLVPEVTTRERASGAPPVYFFRRWSTSGLTATIVGRSPGDFDSAVSRLDINNRSTVVGVALVGGLSSTALVAGSASPPTRLATYSGLQQLWPQISDDDVVVVTDPQSRVVTWPYPTGTGEVFASPGSGFSSVGVKPGISDDGSTVAYIGDKGAGSGIFIGLRGMGASYQLLVAGAGTENFTAIDGNHRAGVTASGSLSTGKWVMLAFHGTRSGKSGVYFAQLRVRDVSGTLMVDRKSITEIATISTAVGGANLTYVDLHHPINDRGDVCCFASLDDGSSAILLARRTTTEIRDAVDFVDPATLTVYSSPQKLDGEDGQERIGVAADGAAQLLLRATVPGPGTVTFKFAEPSASGQGELAAPGSAFGTGAVTAAATNANPTGNYRGYCLYRGPADFVRPATNDDGEATRAVPIDVEFQPTAGPTTGDRVEIELCRPPVVLAHGLWSDAATWKGSFAALQSGSEPRFFSHAIDYSGPLASAPFSANVPTVRLGIQIARKLAHDAGFAASQVDWVGHSMGGVLPRVYYERAARNVGVAWKNAANFGGGEIHKLIVLNSPQWGSPFGNMLPIVTQNLAIKGFVQEYLEGYEDNGAIANLAEGSPAYQSIGATPIPTHALVGVGVETQIAGATTTVNALARFVPPPTSTFLRIAGLFARLTNSLVYRGHRHDLIVLENSQSAGLPTNAVTIYNGGLTYLHMGVTSNQSYYDKTVDLLHAPVAGPEFAPLPAPNLNPARLATPPTPTATANLSFVTPALGATLQPNQSVTVEVTPTGGFTPTSVDLFLGSDYATVTSPPWRHTFTVPAESVGAIDILAIGVDAGGSPALAGPQAHGINVNATLQSVTVGPQGTALVEPLEETRLQVLGQYSDGVTRDLTRAATGTTYSAAPAGIVRVSADGHVTVSGQGTATITASNAGLSGNTDVDVAFPATTGYGTGTAGAGGLVPTLNARGGLPQPGNPGFQLVFDRIRGGAPGQLIIAAQPADLSWQGLRILFLPILLINFPMVASGPTGQAGAGQVVVPIPIPARPSLIGGSFFVQGFFADAAAAPGLSHTQGLAVTIQP